MEQNIYFTGQHMGLRATNGNLPLDTENKIVIYGNTPFYYDDVCMWNFAISGMVTQAKFAKSSLASGHQNVTFCLNTFAENCYTEFRLTELNTRRQDDMCYPIRKNAEEIKNYWAGNPAVFIHLNGLSSNLNYSIYQGYEDQVELEYLINLRDFMAGSMNQKQDRDELLAQGRIRNHLGVNTPTLSALLERMDHIIANPPSGVDDIQIIRGLRYIDGNGWYGKSLYDQYHAERRKARTNYLMSEFAKDKDLVVDAINQRLNEWQNYSPD